MRCAYRCRQTSCCYSPTVQKAFNIQLQHRHFSVKCLTRSELSEVPRMWQCHKTWRCHETWRATNVVNKVQFKTTNSLPHHTAGQVCFLVPPSCGVQTVVRTKVNGWVALVQVRVVSIVHILSEQAQGLYNTDRGQMCSGCIDNNENPIQPLQKVSVVTHNQHTHTSSHPTPVRNSTLKNTKKIPCSPARTRRISTTASSGISD